MTSVENVSWYIQSGLLVKYYFNKVYQHLIYIILQTPTIAVNHSHCDVEMWHDLTWFGAVD